MQPNIRQDKVLILDFGSQYTQLIARRCREIGVYSEIWPADCTVDEIKQFSPRAIILSGSPDSVTEDNCPSLPPHFWELDLPMLGICYGMQLMATAYGGKVSSSSQREFGEREIHMTAPSPLFQKTQGETYRIWMSHGDVVSEMPPEFIAVAKTETSLAAMMHPVKKRYAVQYHPEVTHSEGGVELLKGFLIDVAGCNTNWKTDNIIDDLVESIQKQVGKEKVILGLSGGVDSAVAATLLHKAISHQLLCIFVDHGLLRENEGDEVMKVFAEQQHIQVIRVNAQETFYAALKGVFDPEQKRKIIGKLFIDIFEEQSRLHQDYVWLGQGTIYPDVIESAGSGSKKAHVIKSHHNVGGLPEKMHLKLLEPLRELFKDEVRALGRALGLPLTLLERHPFPGPGLAVRMLGEIVPEHIRILQKADAIFIEMLKARGFYEQTSQAFAVFLPVKSVGVVGDARQYAHVIALRAVVTVDFMTAHWAPLPHEFLSEVSHRIVNEVSGVSRVVYDITGKPPATIEWE